MEKWFIRNNNEDFINIAEELGISKILSKILTNRGIKGIDQARRFLNANIGKLHSPELMRDLVKAGDILKDKIEKKKAIRIVGDYDVDGVTSIYILYTILKRLGARVDYIIPNRIGDGYGINKKIVRKAEEEGIDTIITCDNGISALEEIELAKELGLTVIITDHHELPFIEEDRERKYISPKADAVVDPKHPDCKYPFKNLAGAGVVFKLVEYLGGLYNIPSREINNLLEYVAIATICDVVDLVDENRIMVKYGLELVNSTDNIGLNSLIEESKISKEIGVYHIGFLIGPMINASGRLDSAYQAVELLLSNNKSEARERARKLRKLNDERKDLTEKGLENIVEKIETTSLKDDKVLIIYNPDIHESVAGIIAGRVKDLYYKPTIVLTQGETGVKGSGRSIKEYNIFEELTKCKDLIENFGGHPMAAGLSLKFEDVGRLRSRLNKISTLTEEDLTRKVYVDLGLPIEYVTYNLIEELSLLEPFGKGNSKPIFGERKLRIKKMFKLGAKENVLKFIFQSKSGTSIEGILFNNTSSFEASIIERYGEEILDKLYKGVDNKVLIDIIYYPSINEYRGRTNIQLIVEHYRF